MPISQKDLEEALKNVIPVSHLDVVDQSSGCGDSYAVLIVSEVRQRLEKHFVLQMWVVLISMF